MDGLDDLKFNCTRRHFLSAASLGIGSTALAALLDPSLLAAAPAPQGVAGPAGAPLLAAPHLVPRVKRVIYLFQSGGPSQLDLFDYKPLLRTMNGEELPASIRMGQRLTGMTAHQKSFPLAGSQFEFAQHGKSGAWVSELLPHTARIVDELCFVKSMHTEAINHDPGDHVLPDRIAAGRPAVDRRVALLRARLRERQPAGVHRPAVARARGRSAALLVAVGQRLPAVAAPGRAVPRRQGPGAVPAIPTGIDRDQPPAHARHAAHARTAAARARHRSGDRRAHRPVRDGLPHADGGAGGDGPRRRSRDAVFELYGPEARKPGTFAANCLLARRLAERDVRFIQLYHQGWDQHGNLPNDIRTHDASRSISASAALVIDLKQRGLLDDTLVIWGGEFGRTNYSQGKLDEGQLRPRPPPALLHDLDGRRRRQARLHLRRDRRVRLQRRARPRPRPRLPGDAAAPARHRPRAAARSSTRAATTG